MPSPLKWPAKVPAGIDYDMSCSTPDYFPTIIDTFGLEMSYGRPIDGISEIVKAFPLKTLSVPKRPR